jgi:hypothetical protein
LYRIFFCKLNTENTISAILSQGTSAINVL